MVDPFIFCPVIGILKVAGVLEEGTFLSEHEMIIIEGRWYSIECKFTTLMFENEDCSKANLKLRKII